MSERGPGEFDSDIESWLSGWSLTHDYDPTWDYAVRLDQREDPRLLVAQQAAEQIVAEHSDDDRVPFTQARVYPADLPAGVVAAYVDGTSAEPVIVIDLDAHTEALGGSEREVELAITATIIHELRHAVQESRGESYDERGAEHGAANLPF